MVTLQPVTLAFSEPVIEAEFRRDWALRSLTRVRVATLLGIGMYAGFGLVDLAVAPASVPITWAIRFGIVIPLGLLLFAASFTRGFLDHMQALVGALMVTGGLAVVAIIVVTGEAGQQYYYAGILVVAAFIGVFTRLRFVPAAVALAIIVAAYVLTLPGADLPVVTMINNLAFVAALSFVSMTGAWTLERTSRQDFLRERLVEEQAERLAGALANVRELTGLIPICAWCKKIRDDDGYWRQLESYLGARSRASFSHGMCPDCFERHGAGAPDEVPDAASPLRIERPA